MTLFWQKKKPTTSHPTYSRLAPTTSISQLETWMMIMLRICMQSFIHNVGVCFDSLIRCVNAFQEFPQVVFMVLVSFLSCHVTTKNIQLSNLAQMRSWLCGYIMSMYIYTSIVGCYHQSLYPKEAQILQGIMLTISLWSSKPTRPSHRHLSHFLFSLFSHHIARNQLCYWHYLVRFLLHLQLIRI
mgnify:CR=1 FL=1